MAARLRTGFGRFLDTAMSTRPSSCTFSRAIRTVSARRMVQAGAIHLYEPQSLWMCGDRILLQVSCSLT